MPARKTPAAAPADQTAYLLHIALSHLKPVIDREVLVDPAITLRKLHAVIQAAMGWENAHLHGFALHSGKPSAHYWRVPPHERFEPPGEDFMGFGDKPRSDASTRVRDVLKAPKDKLLYLYDFGDDWQHVITLKSVVLTRAALPHLMKARYACPPEDCGGVGGFIHRMEVLANPAHPEHADVREWLGDDFEPGAFDFAVLQQAVAGLQAKPRKRASIKP